MARKTKKRSAAQRDTVKTTKTTMYARGRHAGDSRRWTKKGRSLAADRRRKAKKTAKSGYGDKGDRKPRAA